MGMAANVLAETDEAVGKIKIFFNMRYNWGLDFHCLDVLSRI